MNIFKRIFSRKVKKDNSAAERECTGYLAGSFTDSLVNDQRNAIINAQHESATKCNNVTHIDLALALNLIAAANLANAENLFATSKQKENDTDGHNI